MGSWIKAIIGTVLGVISLPLLILLPEAGVPLMIIALRLMAAKFAWADRASRWIEDTWRRLRAWFSQQSTVARWLIILVLVTIAIGLVWLVLP